MRTHQSAVLGFAVLLTLHTAFLFGQHTVTTVAGGGPNNLPALSACLGMPQSVAADPSGNVFIGSSQILELTKSGVVNVYSPNGAGPFMGSGVYVDSYGNVYMTVGNLVYKVNAQTGTATVVAGTGTSGFSGDGGPATSAELNGPAGVFADATGNIYIADTWNYVIRKVDATTHHISTVAGTAGTQGYGGDGAAATAAYLNLPESVAVDGLGNIYIADMQNNAVREVIASTKDIVTFVGGSSPVITGATLSFPSGVAVDTSGNVYIADSFNNVVREVVVASSTIETVAGTGGWGYTGDGGLATSATLESPGGVFVDSAGNIYIADTQNYAIRKVVASTGKISTIAGNGTEGYCGDGGPATGAVLYYPYSIATDSARNIYTTDNFNHDIRRVDAVTGIISTVATNLSNAWGVAVDSHKNIYIADSAASLVYKVDAGTQVMTTFAGGGSSYGEGGPPTSAQLSYPIGLFVDESDNLFIVDSDYCTVRKIDAKTGNISTVAGTPATSGLWGTCGYTGDGGPATSATMSWPSSVFVDHAGNIFITDTFNNVVRKVDASTGHISTVAGNGGFGYTGDDGPATSAELNSPWGVVVDAAGNIFITDNFSVVREVDASNGDISTVAGNGTEGFAGDGGNALAAEFNDPLGLAISYPDLLIADEANQRVRRVANLLVPTVVPTVTTAAVTNVTTTTATSGGNVTADGGANVTARGVCWGTNPNPTTSASCTQDGAGTGTFTSSLTGLTANTPYHVRAYATNSVGTSYGADVQFTPSSDFRIWACSNSLTVRAGDMIICEISLASLDKFTGSVGLSYSGLPPHSTCLIFPKCLWLKPSGIEHATAVIATSGKTTRGTYNLIFTGTVGSGASGKEGLAQNSTSVKLIVK
jgi:sugar lactone lactonase YvrE